MPQATEMKVSFKNGFGKRCLCRGDSGVDIQDVDHDMDFVLATRTEGAHHKRFPGFKDNPIAESGDVLIRGVNVTYNYHAPCFQLVMKKGQSNGLELGIAYGGPDPANGSQGIKEMHVPMSQEQQEESYSAGLCRRL